MKFRVIIIFCLCISALSSYASNKSLYPDSLHQDNYNAINLDSLLQTLPDTLTQKVEEIPFKKPKEFSTVSKRFNIENVVASSEYFKIPAYIEPLKIDSLVLLNNPFFIEMVFMGYANKINLDQKPDWQLLYYGKKAFNLNQTDIIQPQNKTNEQIINDLRHSTRDYISRNAAHVYILTFDELPDPNGTKNHLIDTKPFTEITFVDQKSAFNRAKRKLTVKAEKIGPWTHKATGLAQFSENYVSPNWYQGGSNNLTILGILQGKLNYDNKENIQWDNNAEWRLGLSSIEGDTVRLLNTNDDVFKMNSKLGIKASGNWFYSGSVDFSTQFLNSYKGVNSKSMKTSFLSPVRLNIGMGLDYKYKKVFSLMVSPVSYKYIYINEKDPLKLNPNLFGIKKGEDHLSEFGSSFKAIYSLAVTKEIFVDSKLSFYTNYEKVEIDCEVVCNMTINRFLSTRISFNPRYDNTVIEVPGEKAKLQVKQLLSVGFAHKF